MEMKTCPNCGHDNLPRAIFCFQCGRNLDSPPRVRGIHRKRRTVEEAMRFIHEHDTEMDSELAQKLLEAKAKLPPPIAETPITCLRCGTLNRPRGSYCVGCGATLSVPDELERARLVPRASALSDVGQVRENNEDRVGLWARHGVVLAMVADGMGGAVAGEEASRLVTEAIQADFLGEARGSETLRDLTEDEIGDKLRSAIQRANRAIIQQATDNPELQGMGTTVTLAFVRDHRVIIAHVGDSRAYLIDSQEKWINQISDDHSFVAALMASGHITQEQAAVHPMRNVLYRALGQMEDTNADLYSRNLTEGDWLLLCSDGLTRHISPSEMVDLVTTDMHPDDVVQHLVQLANERGGEDNVSAVAIRMERADHVEPEDPPDSIVYRDTKVGLYQSASGDDDDDPAVTQELPAVSSNDGTLNDVLDSDTPSPGEQ